MKRTRITRRTALKGLGAMALAPGLSSCGPGESGPGPATTPPTFEELVRQKIDTVVVLMMENRSFDHYLGSLSLAEGRPVDGLAASMSNPHPDGSSVPPAPATQMCAPDPGHGWGASHSQFNNGANDGFVAEHVSRYGAVVGRQAMEYHARETLSATYALADHYAVCDRWFASVMGPTWPNRFYAMAATSHGKRTNEAPVDDYVHIFDRLDRARKTWADYAGNIPFVGLLPRMSLEYEEFRYLEDFFTDARNGTLPNYSFVEPIYGKNDDHPSAHPLAGQLLISSVFKALAESPHWSRCLLVVSYDEHGGWFDHVPPPTVPDEFASEGFDRLGFRVPVVVAGPYVKQGHVSSTVRDHTSVLRFMQRLWQMDPLGARDAAANDLYDLLDEDALRAATAPAPATLPVITADERVIYAPECVASLPSLAPGAEPLPHTSQPEAEAFMDARYPGGHPKARHRRSDEAYRLFLEQARRLGVFKALT